MAKVEFRCGLPPVGELVYGTCKFVVALAVQIGPLFAAVSLHSQIKVGFLVLSVLSLHFLPILCGFQPAAPVSPYSSKTYEPHELQIARLVCTNMITRDCVFLLNL